MCVSKSVSAANRSNVSKLPAKRSSQFEECCGKRYILRSDDEKNSIIRNYDVLLSIGRASMNFEMSNFSPREPYIFAESCDFTKKKLSPGREKTEITISDIFLITFVSLQVGGSVAHGLLGSHYLK